MGRTSKPGFTPKDVRERNAAAKRRREMGIARVQGDNTKPEADPALLALREWVWEQRIAGYRPGEISTMRMEQFGERLSTARVNRIVESACTKATEATAERLRAVENARLDYYLTKLASRIDMGDDKAINAAIRISERRMKMYGADAPVKVDARVTADVGDDLLDMIQEARDATRNRTVHIPELDDAIDAEVVEDESSPGAGYEDDNFEDDEGLGA